MRDAVIHLHVDAPAKPPEGAACNGCGVCCAAQPCPIGMVVSRKTVGVCQALRWHDESRRYRCGMVSEPGSVLRWLPRAMVPMTSRLALRWIAAAAGCDSNLEAHKVP